MLRRDVAACAAAREAVADGRHASRRDVSTLVMVRFVQDVPGAETTAGSAADGQGAIGKAWLGG